jgi:hypothetical protein
MGNPVILPAIHLQQEWKNVKVYVTAGVPGTQAVGEMVYRDVLAGCEASYKFIALYPSIYCGTDVDDDNNPETDAANDDADPMTDDPQQPFDLYCDAEAHPDQGISVGSGINPDFPVRCDPETLQCILAGDPLTGRP